jgi:hypothetical protein
MLDVCLSYRFRYVFVYAHLLLRSREGVVKWLCSMNILLDVCDLEAGEFVVKLIYNQDSFVNIV